MISIDSRQIEAMLAQIRGSVSSLETSKSLRPAEANPSEQSLDFGQILKSQLDQVNARQETAKQLSERFSLGDDSVNLSDVMIASQKSGIALQTTVQLRNKLVSAYHEIMNMQV